MTRSRYFLCLLISVLMACSSAAEPEIKEYELNYTLKLKQSSDQAELRIAINRAELISQISFNLNASQCSDFKSDAPLIQKDQRLVWKPEGKTSYLSYYCNINHLRPSSTQQSYDAIKTNSGAIFRGDDLFPAAAVRSIKGAHSKASLTFDLPADWSAHTGWPQDSNNRKRFIIDNPERRFDRPTGWIITGDLGTRKTEFTLGANKAKVAVSAFKGSDFRRMDTLSFVEFLWPQLQKAFSTQPETLLIVGADDPLWRGGLSAPNSLYLHADRPLVSENGTSTLVHELVHVFSGLKAQTGDDWIVEGLAEYYSVELLHRAGGANIARRDRSFATMQRWSEEVKSLKAKRSSGKHTAAAALLFRDLDKEIREHSSNKYSLDDLTRLAMQHEKTSLSLLREDYRSLTNTASEVLQSNLLN